MNIPEQYKQLATTEQVDASISQIATNILETYPTLPLFVALLRGAAPFASKLMLEIVRQAPESHPELDYMMVSTYGSGQTAGEPHIVTDLAPTTEVNGRAVIVLDDVLDKGVTANFVFNHLNARGATSVELAVLATKTVERLYPVEASYSGFIFNKQWLVGMGMDDANAANEGYRWLEEIWEIRH